MKQHKGRLRHNTKQVSSDAGLVGPGEELTHSWSYVIAACLQG
jgi:hypothetical protein